MKTKVISSLILLLAPISVYSQFSGDGYYRLQNVKSERYVRVIDNRGSINISTTNADLGALQTVLYFSNVDYDPATVMHISELNSTEYNIATQGTDLYSMMGFGIKFQKLGNGNYVAYQEQKGLRKVLNDTPVSNANDIYGYVLSNDDKYKEWRIIPVSANSDNYIGIKPQVKIGDKFYCAYFSGFPFSLESDGMRAFYISYIDAEYGICITNEISGPVPASTPVIIECSSESVQENKIELLPLKGVLAPISDNLLLGAYFQNNSNKHRNRVDYDSKTMRVIGETENGNIGFITDNAIPSITPNTCYLKADGIPSELCFMTRTEYEEFLIQASVDSRASIKVSPVYSITGKALDIMSNELDRLPQGIYIVNGKKLIVR